MKKRLLLSSIATLSLVILGVVIFLALARDAAPLPAVAIEQPKVYTPEELLVEANKLRAEKGVPPLALDSGLNESARLKAEDMRVNKYYGHHNPVTDKKGYTIVYDVTGKQCYGASENLAGVVSGGSPFDQTYGWPASPAHYAAEIDPKYDTTGFAYDSFDGKPYYVQHFCDLAQ